MIGVHLPDRHPNCPIGLAVIYQWGLAALHSLLNWLNSTTAQSRDHHRVTPLGRYNGVLVLYGLAPLR